MGTGELLIPPQQAIKFEYQEHAYYDQLIGYSSSSQYDIVYLDGTHWKTADAHTTAQIRKPIGIVQTSAVSGSRGKIWVKGIISNGSWSFASGLPVFVGSGGGIVTSAPVASGDWSMRLGIAVTTRQLELDADTPVRVGE